VCVFDSTAIALLALREFYRPDFLLQNQLN